MIYFSDLIHTFMTQQTLNELTAYNDDFEM